MKAATAEAPARAPATAERHARDPVAPTSAGGLAGDLLMLQRHAGNMAVGRMLAGVPGAAGERQANAIADAAVGRRPRAQGEWLTIGPTALRDVPASVVEVLGSRGDALDGRLRSEFEQQIGAALGSVRLHADARAAASARDLGASAYAFGPHVVFGSGRLAPATPDGRWLLAHELTHVAQQRRGRPALQLQTEGTPPAPRFSSTPGQRAIEAAILAQLMGLGGLPPIGSRLVVAAGHGMGEEIANELSGEKGVALLASISAVRFGDVNELNRGFGVGLLSGILSPVTDLFSLAVMGEKLRNFLLEILTNPMSARAGLADEINALLLEVGKLEASAAAVWRDITKSPADALAFILRLPDELSDFAESKAYELGKSGGASIVESILEPFGLGKPKKEEERPPWWKAPLGTIEAGASAVKEWAVGASPWAKIGEKIGYAVGFVAIQVILFAFTEGIGDAIQWVAQSLSRFAEGLAKVSKAIGVAAGKVLEIVNAIGKEVAVVEKAIAGIIAKLLKPAEKLLEPLLKALGSVRERLRAVLMKLLGFAEKEGAQAAESAVVKSAKTGAATIDEALEQGGAKAAPKPSTEPVTKPPETAATTADVRPAPDDVPTPRAAPRPSPDAEAIGARLEQLEDIPLPKELRGPLGQSTQRIRELAAKDPEAARRLLRELEDLLERRGVQLPGQALDEPTRELLGGGRTADDEARAAAEELDDLTKGTTPYVDRFTWQLSEEEAALLQAEFPELPPGGWRTQRPVIMRKGQSVIIDKGRTPKGATIPERYHPGTPDHPPVSVEIKNWPLDEAAQAADPFAVPDFYNNVVDQARRRAANLPPDALQYLVIDLRGQIVPPGVREGIARDLEALSDGILDRTRIRFLTSGSD